MGILEMDFERILGVPFFLSSSHSIMLCDSKSLLKIWDYLIFHFHKKKFFFGIFFFRQIFFSDFFLYFEYILNLLTNVSFRIAVPLILFNWKKMFFYSYDLSIESCYVMDFINNSPWFFWVFATAKTSCGQYILIDTLQIYTFFLHWKGNEM